MFKIYRINFVKLQYIEESNNNLTVKFMINLNFMSKSMWLDRFNQPYTLATAIMFILTVSVCSVFCSVFCLFLILSLMITKYFNVKLTTFVIQTVCQCA